MVNSFQHKGKHMVEKTTASRLKMQTITKMVPIKEKKSQQHIQVVFCGMDSQSIVTYGIANMGEIDLKA